MAYKLLGTDFEDFPTYEKGNRHFIKTPKGLLSFEQQRLREDLYIFQSHYQMSDDVSISGKGEQSLLEIRLNLSAADIHFNSQSRQQVAKAAYGNIAFLAAEDNQADIHFRKNTSYKTFDVHIPLTLLDKYAGESELLDAFLNNIHQGRSSMLANEGVPIDGELLKTIHDIRHCKFEGLTRRIFVESKVYELIALLHQGLSTIPRVKLSKPDLDSIHQAAYLIKENLGKPLTILDLAKQVGINQTKLKEGFKEVFGNTIFGYLQQIRMNEARAYLLNTDLSILQISNLVGYQHMSNFSAAFKNIYGISPLKIRGY
ncbi:MAG: AraC family transcriptional regulator [Candidatus Pseudobacter hemicellulosilyticus]|uniref:AraC family transcriptional regulator n=1 Tax=Candidatus Pseudobacter hemicellulosilyticus TaxID=3121375 RepID=A0AAJ5WPC4_9BACT|nr:MAG: AraC family transcriptional regulator [Pseudobacter sp.]